MPSVKERLAALRARRANHEARVKLEESTHLQNVLLSTIESEEHQIFSKRTIKTQISDSIGQTDSFSDEDEDEDEDIQLVVLPPSTPTKKSGGARLTWRQKEIERARQKAKQFLMETGEYEAMTVPVEPIEPEIKDVPTDVKQEEDDEEDIDEENEMDDEERALQGDEDEEERALEMAEQQEYEDSEEEDESDAENDEKIVQNASEADNASKDHFKDDTDTTTQNIQNAQEPTDNEDKERTHDRDLGQQHHEEEEISGSKETNSDEKHAKPCESREISQELQIKGKSGVSPITDSTPMQVSDDQGDDKEIPEPPTNNRLPLFDTCAFVEDEAEEETNSKVGAFSSDDGDNNGGESLFKNSDGSIVHDVSAPSHKEQSELAKFHRKWEIEKDLEEIKVAVEGSSRMDDEDDNEIESCAVEQKNESQRSEQQDEIVIAEQGAVTVDGGENNSNKEYMDTMFLRDDSCSKFFEDAAEERDDDDVAKKNREKARALWRARQKTKMKLRGDDDASLSKFSLFADAETSRSEAIRSKLESSCRPVVSEQPDSGEVAPEGRKEQRLLGKRRGSSTTRDEQPKWAKRQVCLEKRNQKRRRAISIGKWSFSSHGEKTKANNPKSKSSASIAPSYTARKGRARSNAGSNVSRASAKNRPPRSTQPQSTPTSFNGLLSLLGKQAQTDV